MRPHNTAGDRRVPAHITPSYAQPSENREAFLVLEKVGNPIFSGSRPGANSPILVATNALGGSAMRSGVLASPEEIIGPRRQASMRWTRSHGQRWDGWSCVWWRRGGRREGVRHRTWPIHHRDCGGQSISVQFSRISLVISLDRTIGGSRSGAEVADRCAVETSSRLELRWKVG